MAYFSANDFAIARADENSEIVFHERDGRFGKYVAICDGFGTIEVHDTLEQAFDRIRDLRKRVAA